MNKKHYDIRRIISNASMLSDSTIADMFFYGCDDTFAVQMILDEIEEFSSLLPTSIGLQDLENTICGNKKTKIFGRAVCSSTNGHLILRGDNTPDRIIFSDEEEAFRLGYHPCAKCLNDKYRMWKNMKETYSEKGVMKTIRNLSQLQQILEKEDWDWQIKVYDELGVYVIPYNHVGGEWALFSSCGYSDLCANSTSIWSNGQDLTEYVDINSIKELCSYIREMEDYETILKNVHFGRFSKAELFLAIYHRILLQNMEQNLPYDSQKHVIIGLKGIKTEFKDGKYNLEFYISGVSADELTGVNTVISESDSFEFAFEEIVKQLRDEWKLVLERDLENFICDYSVSFKVPETLDELIEEIKVYDY